ncbi:hypothetical protein [Caulobacter sp. 1776]|uniref:hypothetical protein n=1 Tax=Caulobacter sp. 1776 TaxID=3156420 RepID=UPI003394BAF0
MRTMLHGLAVLAVLATSSAAGAAEKHRAPPEAELAKLLEGRTAGKPVDCINLRLSGASRIIDKTAIVYEMPGGALYVNRPNGADFLDRDATLVTKTSGTELCRMDIVTLVDQGSRLPRGSVSLEAFTPYPKPVR